MAFAVAPVFTIPNAAVGARNGTLQSFCGGAALAARAGAPDPTGVAADSGVFVSGTPGATQTQLPVTFGPGPAGWTQADLDALIYCIVNSDNVTAGSICSLAVATLAAGNITLTFHNRGAGATGTMSIRLDMST